MTVRLCVCNVGIGSSGVFLLYELLIGVRRHVFYGAPMFASLGCANQNMCMYVRSITKRCTVAMNVV